ncbi:MAG: hypothetical protein VX730_07625 [Pseudomonadota bacterium]|nr:hypothetical protein [Pseudomonadota bacterium]
MHTTFELTSKSGILKLKNSEMYADRYLTLELHNDNGMVKAVDLSLAELERALKKQKKLTEVSSTWKDEMSHKATFSMKEDSGTLFVTLHEQAASEDGYRETEYREATFEKHDMIELIERYKMANPYKPLRSPTELARWDKDWT